jgi:hypothetical protein
MNNVFIFYAWRNARFLPRFRNEFCWVSGEPQLLGSPVAGSAPKGHGRERSTRN